jgi:hypothetical protein
MSKASQTIALILVPLSLIFLGFRSCDDGDPSNGGGSSGSHYFGHSWSHSSSGWSHSSGSSFSSGTSRGGFGSHGGSIGS